MSAAVQAKPARRPTGPRPETTGERLVSSDPELFDIRLDFYFGVLDSMCGLHGAQPAGDEKQSGATQVIAKESMRVATSGSETTTWMHVSGRSLPNQATDRTTNMHLAAYAFGRRVWAALTQLPWSAQELLRRYYSSARSLEAVARGKAEYPGFGERLVEADIRAAHRAFLAVMTAAEPPVTTDRDIDGGAPDRARYRQRGAVPMTAAERKALQNAREDYEHAGAGLVRRYGKEDEGVRAAAADVEPLLCGLKAGANKFPPAMFAALARYFLEPVRRRAAIKRGKFRLTTRSVVIVRDDGMTGELVSLREYSRRSGVPRSTLLYRVRSLVHLELTVVKAGQENLYDSDQLDRAFRQSSKS